jgi:hypothetical protein
MSKDKKKDPLKEIAGAVNNRKYANGKDLADAFERLIDAANKGKPISEVDPGGQHSHEAAALSKALVYSACMSECQEDYFTNTIIPKSIESGIKAAVLGTLGLATLTGKGLPSAILGGVIIGGAYGCIKLGYQLFVPDDQECAAKCVGESTHTAVER